MEKERELRRLLEKIELKYLNKPVLKLSAAQKYVEVSSELVKCSVSTTGTVNFLDLVAVFNLIVKPASSVLPQWKQKKDPDTLDVFFLKTIELFQSSPITDESLHIKAQLMCIDVHKLRILGVGCDGTVGFALNYIENVCLRRFPHDGRLWFQHAIIKFSFQSSHITDFKSIDSICRSILARDNPVDPRNILILLDRKVKVDFSNTLLNLALSDFKDFLEKDLQTWSFVKYFQSFMANVDENSCNLKFSELAAIFLFVLTFFKISKNSFHFKIFLETSLNAVNEVISDFWPFFLFATFKLVELKQLELSDAIWFKIFQLLKKETTIIVSSGLNDSRNYKEFLKTNVTNFDEEFSIERDSIVNDLVKYFDHETGTFKEFITLRSDRTLRLGSHFCEQETESEDEHEAKTARNLCAEKNADNNADKNADNNSDNNNCNTHNICSIDNSIMELKSKLANLTNNSSPIKDKVHEINYLNSRFILDTNVLLTGSQQLKNELINRPELFLIPLIVLYEISRLRESTEKASYALTAWDFLLSQPQVQIYNNYGRLLRPEEVSQQLSILSMTRTHSVNDNQIIDLAFQFLDLDNQPVLITEDLNMRLVAKSKKVYAISLNRFEKLCRGGT